MDNENNKTEYKATEVDTGWRRENKSENKATGVKTEMQGENSNSHKATEVDTGWRRENKSENKATGVKTEEQGERSNNHKATKVDVDWRKKNNNGHRTTVVDDEWQRDGNPSNRTVRSPYEGIDKSDNYELMRSASADAFSSINDFRKAVSQLKELTSRSGYIYRMGNSIFEHGGEAVIYKCVNAANNDVVAKIYFKKVECDGSSIQARARVLQYMGTPEGQIYTLPITDIGLVELGGSLYYFEIMPYIRSGNVMNHTKYSFSELVEITKDLNEAIHSMHKFGLIHRDIKPENIYKYNGKYVIGDFGVAMTAVNGITTGTKFHVGTDGYTAPEINMALTDNPIFVYDTKSDYYSLGPTLGALFEGHDVYKDLDGAMISSCVKDGKLPLSREDDNREQLENLFNGLCSFDAKGRFDYKDIKQWLSNHDYVGGYNDAWRTPFSFRNETLNESYLDEMSLFNGVTKDREHWNLGKEMLFQGYFEIFFKTFNIYLARSAQMAKESWIEKDRDKGLAVFLKDLYAPGPIVWKGYTFKSLRELAGKMLVTKTPTEYAEFLQKECVSHWLEKTEGITVDERTVNLVKEIEEHSLNNPKEACYWFGNCFSAEKRTLVCGKEVNDIKSLIEVLFASPADFYFNDGLSKLLDTTKGADLYGFLYSFGFKDLIIETRNRLGSCDKFDKTCLLTAMLDTIAGRTDGADVSIVRSFFVKYGPIGAAIYTQQLVQRVENPVYQSFDNEGKNVLSKILNFKTQNAASVSDLFNAYRPLLEYIETMRARLVDNPFLIMSGVYEKKGVVCTNLIGSFAFDFLERKVPLGFCSFLENADGGGK